MRASWAAERRGLISGAAGADGTTEPEPTDTDATDTDSGGCDEGCVDEGVGGMDVRLPAERMAASARTASSLGARWRSVSTRVEKASSLPASLAMLLEDLDRLRPLTEDVEGAREEAQRLEVARVVLERDLELGERRHPVVGARALEVDLRGEAAELRLRPVLEQALDDLERLVAAAELEQDLRRLAELLDRAVDVAHAHVRVGEAQERERVRRVEVGYLAEDVDDVALATGSGEARRQLVVRRERVAHVAELRVDLRELRDDVAEPVLQVRDVLLDDLADLFVDRERLGEGLLLEVGLTDGLVGRDRVRVLLRLQAQITDLEQRADVARVLGEDLLVLLDSLVVPLLLDKLLGCLGYLFAIDRHGAWGLLRAGDLRVPRAREVRELGCVSGHR